MTIRLILTAAAVLSVPAFADTAADRAKLTGKWQIESTNGKPAAEVWTIEDKSGTLHITRSEDNQIVADFDCNTMGRECEVKDSGKHAKVSMWYSGPKL